MTTINHHIGEVSLIHRQPDVASLNYYLTIAVGTWAPGIWAGSTGILLQLITNITPTYSPRLQVIGVNMMTRELLVNVDDELAWTQWICTLNSPMPFKMWVEMYQSREVPETLAQKFDRAMGVVSK